MNGAEILKERYELVTGRIREIQGEHFGNERLEKYFAFCADFLLLIEDTRRFLEQGGLQNAPLEELERRNLSLYADILPDHYEKSYANPAYAAAQLGEAYGGELCFLYTELRSLIAFVHEERLEELVIRMELFVEIYTAFAYEAEEGLLPSKEDIRRKLYWFANDYAEDAAMHRIRESMCPEECLAARLLRDSDLSDVRFLYAYGEYVSDSDLETAGFMAELPEETVAALADQFTESYRRDLEAAKENLPKRTTVELHYHIGFERIIRRAVENLAGLGLVPAIFRSACSVLDNRGMEKCGFHGSNPNPQYTYDHKDDRALFLDRNYMNRKLEANRAAFEKYKRDAEGYAGSAVLETFGEAEFRPTVKKEAYRLTQEQKRIWAEYCSRAEALQKEYMPEETGFACCVLPVPETGPAFRKVFEECIRINTGHIFWKIMVAYRRVFL